MFRLFLSLIASLALVGCVGQAWTDPDLPSPLPLSAKDLPPEVLALAESLAQTGEIPLVPVPPPPLYKNDKALRPAGAATQEKAREGDPARTGGPTTPPPLPPAIEQRPMPAPLLPPEVFPTPQATVPQPMAGGIPLPAQSPPPGPGVVPSAPMPLGPAGQVAAGPSDVPFEKILQQAQARHAGIDSYIARFTRREVVGGKKENEELMLFKFRKEPFSVYFKWLGDTSRGREVIFVQGKHESKIHTLLAAGDIPLMPAGKRMALSPDNILVQSATRHPITNAGLGTVIERLSSTQAALRQGDTSRGQLNDLGNQRRPDYPACELRVVEHVLPAGMEKALPQGGKRLVCFCPQCQLPVLIQTFDDKGQEVEYYRYDRLQPCVALDDLDFNPDVLWKKPDPKPAQP